MENLITNYFKPHNRYTDYNHHNQYTDYKYTLDTLPLELLNKCIANSPFPQLTLMILSRTTKQWFDLLGPQIHGIKVDIFYLAAKLHYWSILKWFRQMANSDFCIQAIREKDMALLESPILNKFNE